MESLTEILLFFQTLSPEFHHSGSGISGREMLFSQQFSRDQHHTRPRKGLPAPEGSPRFPRMRHNPRSLPGPLDPADPAAPRGFPGRVRAETGAARGGRQGWKRTGCMEFSPRNAELVGGGGGEQLPGQRWKMPPVRPPPLRAETIPAWKFSRGNLTEATRREQNGPGFVQEEGPGFGGGAEGATRMKNKC